MQNLVCLALHGLDREGLEAVLALIPSCFHLILTLKLDNIIIAF